MKFLVTGGAGFIGSNYMHYVVNKYPEDYFVCLDALTYAGNYNNIKDLETKENYKFVKGDITDREFIDKLLTIVDKNSLSFVKTLFSKVKKLFGIKSTVLSRSESITSSENFESFASV